MLLTASLHAGSQSTRALLVEGGFAFSPLLGLRLSGGAINRRGSEASSDLRVYFKDSHPSGV